MECGVSGSAVTTVVNQPLDIQRLINYINAAWIDIQELHADWNFMRQSFQFNTAAGQQVYTPLQIGIPVVGTVTAIGNWKVDSFRNYLTSGGVGGEQFMTHYDYDTFNNLYLFGGQRLIQQQPIAFTVDMTKNLVLGPTPNDIYTVNGQYFRKPAELVADADEPSIPSEFHLGIVYKAMMSYGSYEAAPEVYQRGQDEYNKMRSKIEIDQLPPMTMGAPLV